MSEKKTLVDALPEEIVRVTEILWHCAAIGPADAFAAMMIQPPWTGRRVLAGGDILAMLIALEDLKKYSE
jgi:hypothetical protein